MNSVKNKSKNEISYVEIIENSIKKVSKDVVDFTIERERSSPPTQAFSEFLTNREQGDWAEELVFRAINQVESNIIAVKYGKSDSVVAGEGGFAEFYNRYQDELDTIGKRPDILIYRKKDWEFDKNFDISTLDLKVREKIVPKAIAGIEVRSSAFLVNEYTRYFKDRNNSLLKTFNQEIMNLKKSYSKLNSSWKKWGNSLSSQIDDKLLEIPRRPPRIDADLKECMKKLKKIVVEFKKRSFLTFTPKVEDFLVIHKWIQTYGVPHYYMQVFFDSVYAISFEKILNIISDLDNKNKKFFMDKSPKNQFKHTVNIDINEGYLIVDHIDFPKHTSQVKKLGRGRLLFYVNFISEESRANLILSNLLEMIGEGSD